MIAADTSTWIAFLEGGKGEDVQLLDKADVPMIEIEAGFWQRARASRTRVLSNRRKARLGDVLIAQTCIYRGVPLITRDRNFRAFADAAGLDIFRPTE